MIQAVLWRINKHQCDYRKLNPNGATFSTAGLNLERAGVNVGTCLVVISSGSGRRRLLGIWKVWSPPKKMAYTLSASHIQSFYPGISRSQRRRAQWRVFAKLLYSSDDLGASACTDVLNQIDSRFLRIMQPVPLASQQWNNVKAVLAACDF